MSACAPGCGSSSTGHDGWPANVARWLHEEVPFTVELHNSRRYVFNEPGDDQPVLSGDWLNYGWGDDEQIMIHRSAIAVITKPAQVPVEKKR
jgi:hypothetical protein